MLRFGLGLVTLLLLLLAAVLVLVPPGHRSPGAEGVPSDSTPSRLGAARALAPAAAGDRADQLAREIEHLGGIPAPRRESPLR